jgi:hypothetical protein
LIDAKGNKELEKRAYAKSTEERRQGPAGFQNDMNLFGRPWGFNLEDINANPIRWYHGDLDVNTSSNAARVTVADANRYRKKNIDYKEYPGLDHFQLQTKTFHEAMAWLQGKRRWFLLS